LLWQRIDPEPYRSWTGQQGPIAVTTFFILGAWTLVDPGFHQRVASAVSPKVSRTGVFVCVAFWFLFDGLMIVSGLYAIGHPLGLPEQPLHIFPVLADRVLPPGWKGLFLCGLVGTIVSAMVGYTLASGASLGRELINRVNDIQLEASEVRLTRWGIAVASFCAIVVAVQLPSVVSIWYLWSGALVGPLLAPVWLAYRPKRSIPSIWVTGSMIVSSVASLGWLFYGKRTGNDLLEVVWLGERFSLGTLIPSLSVSLSILAIGWVVSRSKH
jgi:SSS family solute:Na+ symporter